MLLPLVFAGLLAASDDPSASLAYEKASPAVVGITCRLGPEGRYFGTGSIIDPSGLVATSITVVPKEARSIRVYLRGGIVARARSVLTHEEKELSLLRLEAPSGADGNGAGANGAVRWPFLTLGDSDEVRLGQLAVTLGNAFQCIEDDDQVAVGEGVVSGLYALSDSQDESKYKGRVVETTAHLNDGMDGGPLVDQDGSLLGILCLNYSRNRFLGTAVPINELKPLIAAERGWLSDRIEEYPVYAGLEAEQAAEGQVRLLRIYRESPALLAGLPRATSW